MRYYIIIWGFERTKKRECDEVATEKISGQNEYSRDRTAHNKPNASLTLKISG